MSRPNRGRERGHSPERHVLINKGSVHVRRGLHNPATLKRLGGVTCAYLCCLNEHRLEIIERHTTLVLT